MRDGVLTVETIGGPTFVAGKTPLAPDRPYVAYKPADAADVETFGLHNPTEASSSSAGHAALMANDGDPATWWAPAMADAHPWLVIDPERVLTYQRLVVRFAPAGHCDVSAEAQGVDGAWQALGIAAGTSDQVAFVTAAATARRLRLNLTVPPGGSGGLAEISISGRLDKR